MTVTEKLVQFVATHPRPAVVKPQPTPPGSGAGAQELLRFLKG